MNLWDEFYGPNAGYVLELYERYRRDPGAVDAQTRAFFEQNPPPPEITQPGAAAAVGQGIDPYKVGAIMKLADAIRWYGHWAAQLDPLGGEPPDDPTLHLETYGLSEADLRAVPAGVIGGTAGRRAAAEGGTAWEAIQDLRRTYSGRVGYDYLQIRNPEEREWLREAAESGRYGVDSQPVDAVALLRRLTQVEVFEHFLQRSFVAKTRFSIEGLDTLVPLMDEIIGRAAHSGTYNILIGMAHRGRLNVLAHILDKPIDQILAEFKDPLARRVLQNEPTGWAGDVKYHAGAQTVIGEGGDGVDSNGRRPQRTVNITIEMPPNPSHLEAVNPVVEGMARAAGTQANQPGPAIFEPGVTLPIIVHGDAAFPGEGVVAETLNLYRLPGYTTGGTLHIIANNQIGFTTDPHDSRSTLFASDLAKGYRIPVIHVNADDPEGVITAARIALAYREQFHNDFLIDLIGYRRLGHNEGDEPSFTHPAMYQTITQHPTVRKLWADLLEQRGVIQPGFADQLYQEGLDDLQKRLDALDLDAYREPIPPPPPPGAARHVHTAVPGETLREMNRALTSLPEGFTLNTRLARIRSRRDKMLDGDPDWPTVDWSTGEELALATILSEGVPVRLTGQDVERGTFSHRHAVLHDAASGATYSPLQALPQAKASFEVRNSPLSEYAALGFEFGYNIEAGDRLVIWEAQYGDFINNAQTVVDEFIVSARDKWGELPSLVMLLPHGYEGQGPDHSAGRLERFLDMAADNNLRVANCTTSANYFHLLRRQAALLKVDPLPLVVMTPKSLLRHPLVASPLRAFTEGGWQPVIDRQAPPPRGQDEPTAPLPPAENIRRLILCSGKVYVDLVTSEVQPKHPEVAVARLEQLAPFPTQDVADLLAGYPALDEIAWVQEEPENMGAWNFVRPYLEAAVVAYGKARLRLFARPRSASPAEGSNNLHTYNQRRLVEQAYAGEKDSEKKAQPSEARPPGAEQPKDKASKPKEKKTKERA